MSQVETPDQPSAGRSSRAEDARQPSPVWSPLYSLRWLLLLCALAAAAGLYEFTNQPADVFADPDARYTETFSQLYPDRPESAYLLGRRAEQSLRPPVTIESLRRALREASEHYARAVRGGMRGEEDLLYNYALTLMRLEADAALVDDIIDQWRRDFPNSKRRDLAERRVAIEQQLQQLRAAGAWPQTGP